MNIYIRAEASEKHGFGHVQRCLNIAKALKQRNTEPVFLLSDIEDKTKNIITKAGYKTYIVKNTQTYEEEVSSYPAECENIIIDLSHAENLENPERLDRYLTRLKEKNIKTSLIDGAFGDQYYKERNVPEVDILIQPYIGIENTAQPATKNWIAGAQYAVMSDAYHDLPAKVTNNTVQHILITFGGSDPQGLTARTMEALLQKPQDMIIRVIIGPYFSEEQQNHIHTLAAQASNRFELITAAQDLIPHYQWADIGLVSSGLSRYECAACGLPTICSALYPAHINSSEAFAQAGLSRYIGLETETSPQDWLQEVENLAKNKEIRSDMSINGQKLIDGQGTDRLAKTLLEILNDTRN